MRNVRNRFAWTRTAVAAAFAAVLSSAVASDFQGATHLMPFDEDTINYSKAEASGPIPRLQQQVNRGEVKLQFDEERGYLPSVLDALKVPRTSQLLVFSKTSFQRERISPKTPRALFFSEDIYIGFIPGSPLLEISSVDPKLGAVFYTLDQTNVDRPRFVRTDQCLECHATAKTMGVPGHLLRSFAVDDNGAVDMSTGTSLVNHRTPIAERWGGWYVTGEASGQAHRGNLFGKADFARHEKEPAFRGTQRDLGAFFDPAPYLQPTSDIAALLVIEHQAHMHNFITRLNYESTLALQQYGHLNYLRNILDAFLKYTLFTEEVPLGSPVQGSAQFMRDFTAAGPKDKQGRSLRDFDLQTRLFKYPCSFLIYSEAFDHLPPSTKEQIYQRLFDVLTGKDNRPEWRHLAPGTRQAIREILVETKRDLPAYWKPRTATAKPKK